LAHRSSFVTRYAIMRVDISPTGQKGKQKNKRRKQGNSKKVTDKYAHLSRFNSVDLPGDISEILPIQSAATLALIDVAHLHPSSTPTLCSSATPAPP